MNGSHVTEHYTAYLENTLPEALRREVDAHLRDCPQCAAELAEMRALVATLREMPAVAVPEGFAQRVSGRVPRRAPRAIWWRGPVFAGGLLASALAVMLVVMHFNTTPVTQVADSRMDKQAAPPAQVETGMRSPAVGENVAAEADKALPSPIAAKAEVKPAAPRPLKSGVRDPFTGGEEARKRLVGGKVGADSVPTQPRKVTASAQKTDDKERVEIAAAPPTSTCERAPREVLAYNDAAETNAVQPHIDGARFYSKDSEPSFSVKGETAFRLHVEAADRIEPTSEATSSSTTSVASAATSNMSKSRGDAVIGAYTQDETHALDAAGWLDTTPPALPLPFGNVQVVAKSMPDGKGGAVALRVDGAAAVTGTVQTTGTKAQAVTLTPQAREMTVSLPKSKSAVVYTITLQSEGKTERCTLIAPAPVTRKAKVSLRATNQPALRTLTTLANQAGIFVLCPQTFTERKLSLNVKDVSPQDALKSLTEQHRHRAEFTGNVVYIAPVK